MAKFPNNKKLRVVVGLSGGVDSSVAAYLLKEQGYEVTCVYMQCWDTKADGCGVDEDRAYAVQAASSLGIKFESLDFKKEYGERVIEYFYDEYTVGRTPNPDVMCNKEIKFGLFFDWVMKNGYDYVATGHYAKVKCGQAKPETGAEGSEDPRAPEGGFAGQTCTLLKGTDDTKDQSYFLYLLDQTHLQKTLFPLGNMTKEEVRKLARKTELPTANRPDSQGICFIGEIDIRDFLKQRIKPKKGLVKYTDGKVIGEHEGAWFYTIGQRHGFKVNKYFGKPLYVLEKDVENNVLIVGLKQAAFSSDFEVAQLHWISGGDVENVGELECEVRIRHLGDLHECVVTAESNKAGKPLVVHLKKPVFGVAPGQSAVFYSKDIVLGGGVIT